MPQKIKDHAKTRMEKAITALKRDLQTLRAGRASIAMLDRVQAEYYGTLTPINQLSAIHTPDSRTILITPWDKTVLPEIEKAILKADLGLIPNNDGSLIRLNVPLLTNERRTELAKTTRKFGEEAKIAIRNVRRDANDEIKRMEKKEISEDESYGHQEEVQKLTNAFVSEVDQVLAVKEKEIMEV